MTMRDATRDGDLVCGGHPVAAAWLDRVRPVCAAALGWIGGVSGAAAQVVQAANAAEPPTGVPVLVLTTNLKVTSGRLTSLDMQNGATLIESSGKTQRFEPGRTLALAATDAGAEPTLGIGAYASPSARGAPDASLMTRALLARTGGVLVTAWGERITGSLRTTDVGKDRVGWSSARLGVFEVPLEGVSSVRIGVAESDKESAVDPNAAAAMLPPPLPAPGADDAVVLRNGDTVRGLVTRVDSSVSIEGEGAGAGERVFEAARVSGVVLANPVKGVSGQTIWLADGSVLNLVAATTEKSPKGPLLRLETRAGGKGTVPLAEVRAWVPAAERVTSLSSMPLSRVTALSGRVFAPRPLTLAHPDDVAMPGIAALGASDIVMLGGVEAAFTLPKGARRFVATVALEDDAGEWGDCEVVLTGAGGEGGTQRVHLSEEQPAAAVSVPLGGGELVLRVEGGRFGTVKDRVRVMRGLVLSGE
jgi:hypothetical protein